jgi:hypothetical protein
MKFGQVLKIRFAPAGPRFSGSNGECEMQLRKAIRARCSPRSGTSRVSSSTNPDRKGSVLLVVIGLLSLLLLAGIAFYTFASQESSSAEEFSEASKEGRAPTTQAESLFNFALEQLILGPDDTLVHSALRGGRGTGANQLPWGRHSLLAGILGNDTTPYNGVGIHLRTDFDGSQTGTIGKPFVDQDFPYDNAPDNANLLNVINFSASANSGTAPTVSSLLPAPDTGVTYPDINSLYLSYTGSGMNGGGDVPVHIPSFHRPQYRLGPNWLTDAATSSRVFRPHQSHMCAGSSGRTRFLASATASSSGHLVSPFPFSGLNQGVWDLTAPPAGNITQYQYDADNDGDGIREGIWMDLDHPIQELGDGRKYVPMFSFTVTDADGLINLNSSGNRNSFAPAGTLPLANGGHISRSNMGLSRSEINPEWGMLADPTIDGGLSAIIDNEYRTFWNLPTASYASNTIPRIEVANRDWFHILHGRASFVIDPGSPLMTPRYRVDGNDYQPRNYFAGKWENPAFGMSRLINNMAPPYNAAVSFSTIPQPGQEGIDDDGDLMAGRATRNSFLNMFPSMGHPFDPIGAGTGLQTGSTGLQAMRVPGTIATWLSYYNYQGLSELDINGNSTPDSTIEDQNGNGFLDGVEDLNRNGILDPGEDLNGNGLLDWGEDFNHNYNLDIEDVNGNGTFDYAVSAFPNYHQASGGTLFTAISGLQEEADESVAEPGVILDSPAARADSMFDYDEEFGLHGTNLDLSKSGFSSRLRNLAPANFQYSNQAALIRSQYCVSSFDRIQYSMGANNLRSAWEINYDLDQDGTSEFPPAVFAMSPPLLPYKLNPLDPIRAPLRRVLLSEHSGSSTSAFATQLRLNMNLFLSGFNSSGPIYRPLTPHPVNPGNAVTPTLAAMMGADASPGQKGLDDDDNGYIDYIDVDGDGAYTAGVDLYDYNEVGNTSSDDIQPNSPTAHPEYQEFWARRDRQQMARDIYVLLYLLGGGSDTLPSTGDNSGQAIHLNARLKEMAQFAVNYVDSLDRDNVITKFEYDRNLGNGWNLGDNPYETADDTITDPAERGVVYGVETQQLTFSEILGLISRRVPNGAGTYKDHIATEVDDSQGASDRFYTFIELRNASPYPLNLSDGSWQIAVQDLDPDGTPETGDETDRVQLTLLGGDFSNSIAPGALFTIGNRGGPDAPNLLIPQQNLPSVFKVDATGATSPDFTATTTWIAPATPAPYPAAASTGAPDLDLIPLLITEDNTAKSNKFRLTKGTGLTASTVVGAGTDENGKGNFLFGGPGGNVTDESAAVTFILRRRAHPYRTMPQSYTSSNPNHVAQSNDNPWVEVDRFVMPAWLVFALTSGDGSPEVQTALTAMTSRERSHPFAQPIAAANDPQHAPIAVAPYRSNTIGNANSNSTLPFSVFQLHFDRDFTATSDMFTIPLYGPREVTYRGGYHVTFDESTAITASTTAMLAQERFLRPTHTTNVTIPLDVRLDNRWYRLLEFLECPTRTNATITSSNSPFHLRTPGKINLNTIRQRGVLAGLLDDWSFVSNGVGGETLAGSFSGAFASSSYQNILFDGERDWWAQTLQSRDGTDPVTGMILPGMAHSRPFRGMNFLDHRGNSIDDTVLRSLPAETGITRRGLFEARTSADTASNLVDPLTRHRLLRKVVNNSTTRSNVFIVWISVGYFEAIQHTNGDVQIGGPLSDSATHRGFFVIDRSLPEKAVQSGQFDYQKFLEYRKTLQ